MLTEKTIEKVMSVLYKRYKKKGSDFVFKSRHIAKELDTSPQSVGQILTEAVKRGYPVGYYTKSKTSNIYVWQTVIGDKHKRRENK